MIYMYICVVLNSSKVGLSIYILIWRSKTNILSDYENIVFYLTVPKTSYVNSKITASKTIKSITIKKSHAKNASKNVQKNVYPWIVPQSGG